jgi:O-succinylbenzoate synthase
VSDAARLASQADLEGIDAIVPFRVPLTVRFRGVRERQGLLLHGPHGWGEWSPFDEYDDAVAAVWLDAAISSACTPPPSALRDTIPVNVTVPAVEADAARTIVAAAGCRTAKIKVAEPGGTLADDIARVVAVREALGPDGSIRVDANAAWGVDEAVEALGRLEAAAGGLEYVEQPCTTLEELAEVRARTGVRIAADEAIRRDHADPALLRDAVDIAVIKVQPAGGVDAALALVRQLGLPAVISSALDTSVGLAAGVRLAAALDALPHACGLATGLLLADDVVKDRVLPNDGVLLTRTVQESLHTVRREGSHVASRERTERLMVRLAACRRSKSPSSDR